MANISPQNRQDSQTQHTQLSIETKEALKRPTFNVWEVENDQMLALLEHMFNELDLLRHFKMEPKTLWSFLCCVWSSYRQNPFHNFQHSFCVTQMMYSVISLCHLQEHLSAVDIVTLMVASLCHDLDHPGLNNVYQVNARTDLATRYENKSPLENHHCTITLHILSQPEHNIFCYSNHEDTNHIKKGVVELILATDLSYHSEILQMLQNIENLDFTNRDCVKSLMKGLIKFCDISNEVRPTEVADRWADALLEEYFMQSDREKSEGLPVTPYMNRDTVTKAEAQRTFIICLLTPLCQALSKLLPQMEVWMLQPLKEAELRYHWQIEEVKTQNL
ncbi:high affinity cGMP-specific 3',5'-cyclic phosphodiesterase 9A-like [Bombina bombina]|uniref:high affinity cGMP-specific 3',5'-cyclic phosphodiesterase 9A-like n=1 Tax=Bombina bombina TaxID=8345 RepID=UPI00235ADFAC|nr:high affinity cGMP-specific 3',5'-cyclic phosphodiesterase 9A-like [Bombina bombina]